MRILLISVLLLIILPACHKDKLEGNLSVLKGEWEWQYSVKTIKTIWSVQKDTLYAGDFEDSRGVRFHEKGIVEFLKNNEVILDYRLVFSFTETRPHLDLPNRFIVKLDNDEELRFLGDCNDSVLECSNYGMPFFNEYHGDGSITYSNVYKKVK